MGAGPSVMYATHALDAFTQLKVKTRISADIMNQGRRTARAVTTFCGWLHTNGSSNWRYGGFGSKADMEAATLLRNQERR